MSCDSEINEYRPWMLTQHDVIWLDVSVNDALFPDSFDRECHIVTDPCDKIVCHPYPDLSLSKVFRLRRIPSPCKCILCRGATTNAAAEDVQEVKKTHSLKKLWDLANEERKGKISDETWSSYDVRFVAQCVDDFEAVDPDGDRFRYFGKAFAYAHARKLLTPSTT